MLRIYKKPNISEKYFESIVLIPAFLQNYLSNLIVLNILGFRLLKKYNNI